MSDYYNKLKDAMSQGYSYEDASVLANNGRAVQQPRHPNVDGGISSRQVRQSVGTFYSPSAVRYKGRTHVEKPQ